MSLCLDPSLWSGFDLEEEWCQMLCFFFLCVFLGSGDSSHQPYHQPGSEESWRLQNSCLTGSSQAQQGLCLSLAFYRSFATPSLKIKPYHSSCSLNFLHVQIVTSASIDLQDYTYYFVAAPWLSVKLLRLLQCYPPPGRKQYYHVTGGVTGDSVKDCVHLSCFLTKKYEMRG